MGLFDFFRGKGGGDKGQDGKKDSRPSNSGPTEDAGVSYKNHTYGQDTPWARTDSTLPVRRHDNSITGEERNLLRAPLQEDESKGRSRWPARVLRVENRDNANEGGLSPFSWFDAIYSDTNDEEIKFSPVQITAIADCGIHAAAWGETCVGAEDFNPSELGSQTIIDKVRDLHHGLFTAVEGAQTPNVGDMVWITWADLANHQDGLYLGPVIPGGPADPNSINSRRDPRKAKDPCLDSAAPSGLNSRNVNAGAVSSLGGSRRKQKVNAKKDRGKKPIGKGVFTGFPDLKTHKVKQAVETSLSWVCYTGLKQKKTGELESLNLSKVKKFSQAYHKKGIRTYIMGYPAHGHEESFVSELFTIAGKSDAIGIVVNLDHYYNGETPAKPYEKENYLITKLRDFADKNNFCIGLTATDIAGKKEAPWKIFADKDKGVDFAIPQVLSQNYSNLRDQVIDANNAAAQPGPTVGQPTSFNDIRRNNFKQVANLFQPPEGYASISEFMNKWYGQGFDKKSGDENFNTRTLYLMGAAEILEKYWKGVLGAQAKVVISSHKRPGAAKGNHTTGAATDIMVYDIDGKKIPALQVWASIMKMQVSGRIPLGGTGLYLNVSPSGIKGIEPSAAGKGTPVGGISAPGSSANPHYDMRGFLYAPKAGGKNVQWINADKTGSGKDDIKATAATRRYLNRNRPAVGDYVNGAWQLDGNYANGFIPAIGGQILNLKQLFGLETTPIPIPKTAAEDPFVTYFRAWKNLGFKYIIPALGMVGNSPKPDGWKSDGYNTAEKSPWRMREEAAWTFTAVKEELGNSMANSVIWWNWDGASVTNADWPERRWDIIRELGDSLASAEKVMNIKSSSSSEKEKNRVAGYRLGSYMKQSDSPGEALKKKQEDLGKEQIKTPAETVPTESPKQDPPSTTGLTEKQKKEKEEQLENKIAEIKEKEKELEKLKTDLKEAETSGNAEKKQEAENKVVAAANEIKKNQDEANTLKAELNEQKTAGQEEGPELPCPRSDEPGAPGQAVTDDPRGRGEIKSSQLPGVKFVEAGFAQYPLKGGGYIVIHNPGGGVQSHERLVNFFRKPTNNNGKLGVHFSILMNGDVRQHTSLDKAVNHAPPLNYVSYGIEVMNPSSRGMPSKKFKPGPPKQYEELWKLVKKISRNSPNFSLTFPNLKRSDATFFMGSTRRLKGVIPHSSFNGNRSDGRFSVLYMAMRYIGKPPAEAYKISVDTHNYAKTSPKRWSWIEIQGLEPKPVSGVAATGAGRMLEKIKAKRAEQEKAAKAKGKKKTGWKSYKDRIADAFGG